MADSNIIPPRVLIQNAHNGKAEFVLVVEGRCGRITTPMDYPKAQALVRYIAKGGSLDLVRAYGWPAEWRENGYNGAIAQAERALLYLADNDRPIGGEQFPNAACCYQIAEELAYTRAVFAAAIEKALA